jgi:hypothetical protein
MKTQLFYAYERIGCQRLYLNQQFISEPVYVSEIGLDGGRRSSDDPAAAAAGRVPVRRPADVGVAEPVGEKGGGVVAVPGRRAVAGDLRRVGGAVEHAGAPGDLLEAYDKQNPDGSCRRRSLAVGQVPGQPGQPQPPGSLAV